MKKTKYSTYPVFLEGSWLNDNNGVCRDKKSIKFTQDNLRLYKKLEKLQKAFEKKENQIETKLDQNDKKLRRLITWNTPEPLEEWEKVAY